MNVRNVKALWAFLHFKQLVFQFKSKGKDMGREQFSSENIRRCGKEWYEKHIRALVETKENYRLMIYIDIETLILKLARMKLQPTRT